MKKLSLVLCLFVFLASVIQAQNFQWQTIGTTGISNGTPSGGTILNGKIYVNGTYYLVDGQQVNNFAVVEGDIYSESGTVPGSKTFGYGYSVATNMVYVCTRDSPNYMYEEDQATGEWSAVPISFNHLPRYMHPLDDSSFLISGDFTIVNGISANYVCLWNAVSGSVTDIGGLPGPDSLCGLTVFGERLLIPYYIPSASDIHFKQWNLNTKIWDVDSTLLYGNMFIYGFCADSNRLYLSYLGFDANHHIALYENGNWTVIGDAPVSGMAVDVNGDLIVCGNFGSIGGTGVNNDMARYSNGNWYSISLGMTANSAPYKVLVCNGVLYAIGYIKHNGLKVGVMRWVDATGIAPGESSALFSVNPNPASEIITITEKPNSLMKITDLSGKIVQAFRTVDNQSVIDVSTFPMGMYVVENVTQKGRQKLIVTH